MKVHMRKVLFITILCILITGVSACSKENDVVITVYKFLESYPTDKYLMESNDFVYGARANPDMFIIDLREPDEYAKEHIKYSVNIPWGPDLWANIDKIPFDKPVSVYCESNAKSSQAAALLALAGFNVKSVEAGWEEGILNVESVFGIIENNPNRFNQVAPPDIKDDFRDAIYKFFKPMEEYRDTRFDYYTIYFNDAMMLYEEGDPQFIFLCIDESVQFQAGPMQGGVNIPFGADMYKDFDSLSKDKVIIVYGEDLQKAGHTTVVLRLLGFDAILTEHKNY